MGAAVVANRTAWRPSWQNPLAHPRTFPATPAQSRSIDIGDRLGDLKDVYRASVCIERFIRPFHLCEHDEFSATPTELGALVAAVNAEFERRMQDVDAACESLQKVLRKAARKALKAKSNAR
ncbi:hypothetical protein [Variovorax ginsengisoli]|uniref:Uncharacterized protein n=1 Tax=Variovorax ginsengisoli TaxID=363844 RepID=A0ABT8RYB6_9BURK|nr:hypothetical protein [Variovorax ginsengisoli]MDN8612088.1 hypothetical protein [Variovorax ginsengisoli]MDO1531258.1 hypothetical protein [Variovorax ginsengisoli]